MKGDFLPSCKSQVYFLEITSQLFPANLYEPFHEQQNLSHK